MPITDTERSHLRQLATQVAEITFHPSHLENVVAWRQLNGLRSTRPMVNIRELPLHEMNVNDELTPLTADPFYREVETALRRTIYYWNHLRCDLVITPTFPCPLVIEPLDFGMEIQEDRAGAFESGIGSHHYHPQISGLKDVEKIAFPQVVIDHEATEANYSRLNDLFGDILRIERRGAIGSTFAAWDRLVRWYGVTEALTDLALRPEIVHAAMDRLTAAYSHALRQYVELGILHPPTGTDTMGSGGYTFTDDLPAPGFDPARVRPIDVWGYATAQIFSEVSPAMHEEFALRYERPWLEQFGLSYYGCCEPLDRKMDIVGTIRNLRKVSMSPWVNVDRAVKAIGDRYVFSRKPNPAILATEQWNPAQARADLREVLEKGQGCHIELIMKDISTVRHQPQRAWEWVDIAMELAREFAR